MQIWRIPLELSESALERAASWLDATEQARASRFRFDLHRRHFVAAHCAMRAILADALGCSPREVLFGVSASGKPFLTGGMAGRDLHFNLTHSGEVALLVLSPGREVGIDIECFDPADARALEVVAQFSPAEQAALDAHEGASRVAAFYRCWVRKEALLKATGAGLSAGLHRFTVSVDEEARLVESDLPELTATPWSLLALDALPREAAALAVRGSPPQVQRCDWVWR